MYQTSNKNNGYSYTVIFRETFTQTDGQKDVRKLEL